MSKRIVTKVGDLFCVEIDNKYKCYFQYVANDMTMLNSSVIRVFSRHYPLDYDLIADDVVKDNINFSAHTVLRFCIMNHAWYKVGRHDDIGNPKDVCFRWFKEIDFSKINKSYNWIIWKISEEQRFIGEISEKYKSIDLGIVFSYENIVNKIRTGEFLLKHVD